MREGKDELVRDQSGNVTLKFFFEIKLISI